jgi:hypothetical protein
MNAVSSYISVKYTNLLTFFDSGADVVSAGEGAFPPLFPPSFPPVMGETPESVHTFVSNMGPSVQSSTALPAQA